MHRNAQLITDFYSAFADQNGQKMSAAYDRDATFSDPVFQNLKGPECGGMWRMLTGQAKDFELTFRDVVADDTTGSAHWDARYTFSATGRVVNNSIEAVFEFNDGKIHKHVDTFDLWKWTRMALGVPGVLLGWTPLVQNKVRGQANAQLQKFLAKEANESGSVS
ncbi:MAG: ketosteroid isomerase-like protein [Myxococcota bacterium]|jgi:ketosteroid isomerase-like protein